MNGVELALRMSYITNALHFCGPEESNEAFLNYVAGKQDEGKVRSCLKRFEGLYPYLSAIAEKHSRDFLDYDVVEAYWFGNSLLDAFTIEDMKGVIEKLMGRGLPKSIAERCIQKLKPGMVPHHNFNVFHVGVGKVTGSVPTTLTNMDNCRTSHGTVLEVLPSNQLLVKTTALRQEGKHIVSAEDTKTAAYLPDMLGSVKKNDLVALHWGFAAVVLTKKQAGAIDTCTKRMLDVVECV